MNLSFLIALLAGAAGGNVAGGFLKPLNLGLLGNSLFGAAGGYSAIRVLESVFGSINTNNNHIAREGANTSSVVMALLVGAFGGAVLVILIGAIRARMNRR